MQCLNNEKIIIIFRYEIRNMQNLSLIALVKITDSKSHEIFRYIQMKRNIMEWLHSYPLTPNCNCDFTHFCPLYDFTHFCPLYDFTLPFKIEDWVCPYFMKTCDFGLYFGLLTLGIVDPSTFQYISFSYNRAYVCSCRMIPLRLYTYCLLLLRCACRQFRRWSDALADKIPV